MDELEELFPILASYPRWLVITCLTAAAVAGIYVLLKLLKWGLYLLMVAVLLGGVAAVIWLWWQP